MDKIENVRRCNTLKIVISLMYLNLDYIVLYLHGLCFLILKVRDFFFFTYARHNIQTT